MKTNKILYAIGIGLLLAWSAFVVAAYFVVQKPLALQVSAHLLSLAWTLLVTSVLGLNALALGTVTVRYFVRINSTGSSIALAGGIGLGELGLLGFGLAASGLARFGVLLGIQILLLAVFIWRGVVPEIFQKAGKLVKEIRDSSTGIPAWMQLVAVTALALTFLMTLLPPVEAFDALLYHLAVPDLWLRDAGLQAYNIPHYWFPDLVEGTFVWGLGLGTDIVPQQLHFLWAVFTALLLWDWTRSTWSDSAAWWVWMLLASMPSLPLLASWAYTDLALAFFCTAALYTLWQGRWNSDYRWWRLGAIFAGMAMGVKYTSAMLLLAAGIILSVWTFRQFRVWLKELACFGGISGLTACVWYIRNWIWMGNPFYPFLFAGKYWDEFRAAMYSGAGSGAGWDLKAILSLPLTITLGYQDANLFDGKIGPIFLLAFPLVVIILLKIRNVTAAQRQALFVILTFFLVSSGFWMLGYVATRHLWQARLLFPALIPAAVPTALGIVALNRLDSHKLRLSFILTGLLATVIGINLLDGILSLAARNPLALAVGINTRENYMQTYQPGYAQFLRLAALAPENAKIYALFEPRSYGAERSLQPDALLDNFPHDKYLYGDPESILSAWRSEGYTHVLVNYHGAEFILLDKDEKETFQKTIRLLKTKAVSPDRNYELFEIPNPP